MRHALSLVAFVVIGGASLVAQVARSELIPTALVENGRPIELELVVYSPAGAGPFPTVMFNHGSTGSGTDPTLFSQTWHSPAVANFFTARGWQVIFPQRRGRGRSGGLYDEGFAANRASGYTCDPARSLAGFERALTDLDAVVAHLRQRPGVDPARLLIGGWSRGAILAIVHAGTRPGVFLGAVNFVGGWMSDTCPNPTAINTVSFARGGAFAGPTAWIYGENDSFYSLAHSRTNHAAFAAAGGRGAFHTFNLGTGQNGHFVHQFPDQWSSVVDELLRSLPAPSLAAATAFPLANLSVRVPVGGPPLILGFVLGGDRPLPLVVRGLGPALRQFGLTDVADQPTLTLFDHEARVRASIGAWSGRPALVAAFAAAGAFPLDPASADAAAQLELPAGAYTLHLQHPSSAPRLALGEIYAAAPLGGSAGLANLSARVALGEGAATAIMGFAVGGTTPARVLARIAGPALAAFGVTDASPDPRLAVFDSAGREIASNDDWTAPAAAGAAQAGAFAFVAGSRDAAASLTLTPGAYTLHATGTGTALLELYSLPPSP